MEIPTIRKPNVSTPRILLWEARKLNRHTARDLARAQQDLEHERDQTQDALERLGQAELDVYDTVLRRFAMTFEEIKNVELTDLVPQDAPNFVVDYDVSLRGIDFTAVDVMKTTAVGGSTATAAGLITFAGVGTFASASTGTAIGTLSGAAATNATLAWLGGGSLAAGGFGVAGGMVVLGGIVAAPVLAVGGLVLHKTGRKALANAKSDQLEADKAIAEMDVARERAGQIFARASHVLSLLERLSSLARERVAVLEHIVEGNADYATYDERTREHVRATVTLVKTLRALMDAPLVTEDGSISEESGSAVTAASRVLQGAEAGT